jgi:hypothetical protein
MHLATQMFTKALFLAFVVTFSSLRLANSSFTMVHPGIGWTLEDLEYVKNHSGKN